MKFTTLSLVATLAISSAYAGGDIVPVAAAKNAPNRPPIAFASGQ